MLPVIRVENLSKKYRLGVINRQMLVDQIESWVASKLGRLDPHASVFEKATDRMPTPYDFWALKDVRERLKKAMSSGSTGSVPRDFSLPFDRCSATRYGQVDRASCY
jgi:lipopolysaccharide transport system ATP-binding protein